MRLLHIIITAALVWLLTGCATDYLESSTGARLHLGQLGGQKRIEKITVDGITISGYGVDNRESWKDLMDFAGTYAGIQGAVKMLESDNATKLATTKSGDNVTTARIVEGEKTTRVIDSNKTKVNLAELGAE